MENLFRKEVLEHKKYRLEGNISLVQPPAFRVLTLLIFLIVLVSLVYLALGDYTRKERVSGSIQPDNGLIKLNALQTGIITEFLVKEGEAVGQGDPIIRVRSDKHGAEERELNQSRIDQLTFQLSTLNQQLIQQKRQQTLITDELLSERNLLNKRLEQLQQQDRFYTQRIENNQNILEQISTLANTGYISELELKRQKDTLLSLQQQSSSANAEQLQLRSQITQANSKLEQLPIEHARNNGMLSNQIEELKVQLSTAKQQKFSEIRAPLSGTVTGLLVKVGSSIVSGQNLLSILPQNSKMTAVLYVPTSSAAFIQKNQSTRIRYHAFPYEKFGIYQGVITEISANVLLPEETEIPNLITQPAYRIVVDLDSEYIDAYGRQVPLRPGMLLDADIVLETRSLLQWLFDPVMSIKGNL